MIPLSTNSGLIGWVPHTDTLHSLIRDYREKKKILLNIEHRLMLRVSIVGTQHKLQIGRCVQRGQKYFNIALVLQDE